MVYLLLHFLHAYVRILYIGLYYHHSKWDSDYISIFCMLAYLRGNLGVSK
jgi:hypothetical protein